MYMYIYIYVSVFSCSSTCVCVCASVLYLSLCMSISRMMKIHVELLGKARDIADHGSSPGIAWVFSCFAGKKTSSLMGTCLAKLAQRDLSCIAKTNGWSFFCQQTEVTTFCRTFPFFWPRFTEIGDWWRRAHLPPSPILFLHIRGTIHLHRCVTFPCGHPEGWPSGGPFWSPACDDLALFVTGYTQHVSQDKVHRHGGI